MIDKLVEALTDEFAGDVVFVASVPATITPPAVIVAPGEPFLNPGTMGTVEENWRVLVAVSIKEPKLGIDKMRDLSLRVRRAVNSVGGLWRLAGGPYSTMQTNAQMVISANEITFKYLDQGEEG
jgi:hypothetical protein